MDPERPKPKDLLDALRGIKSVASSSEPTEESLDSNVEVTVPEPSFPAGATAIPRRLERAVKGARTIETGDLEARQQLEQLVTFLSTALNSGFIPVVNAAINRPDMFVAESGTVSIDPEFLKRPTHEQARFLASFIEEITDPVVALFQALAQAHALPDETIKAFEKIIADHKDTRYGGKA